MESREATSVAGASESLRAPLGSPEAGASSHGIVGAGVCCAAKSLGTDCGIEVTDCGVESSVAKRRLRGGARCGERGFRLGFLRPGWESTRPVISTLYHVLAPPIVL